MRMTSMAVNDYDYGSVPRKNAESGQPLRKIKVSTASYGEFLLAYMDYLLPFSQC